MTIRVEHEPDARTCRDCDDLARLDGLDLARLAEVEHFAGYSVLRPRRRRDRPSDPPRWRAVRVHSEPDAMLAAIRVEAAATA